MALSDQWTLAQLRTRVLNEVVDPGQKWFTTSEINGYINEWQWTIQSQFEFVWGSATWTNSTTLSTVTLSSIADGTVNPAMLRLDAIYFCPGGTDTSTRRLFPRSLIDLDLLQRDWRTLGTNTATALQPEVCYQNDLTQVSFWPPPPATGTAGTYVFEYPVLTTLVNDSDVMQVPSWARYTCAPFCAFKCFKRFGANQDIPMAMRRRKQFDRQMRMLRKIWDAYYPQRAEMLRPGRKYASHILNPRQVGGNQIGGA